MKKFLKKILFAFVFIIGLGVLTGCTKSFCSVNDKAVLYSTYVTTNIDTIKTNATSSGYMLPGDTFWTYIDTKVDEAFTASIDVNNDAYKNEEYAPKSYIDSYIEYSKLTDSEDDQAKKATLVNQSTLKAVIRYAGYNSNHAQTLWANYDTWIDMARSDDTIKDYAPTYAFITYFKSTINTGVGSAVTCITPENGYFGINEDTYVEGKTWGQAFSEYGFIEGLLVYPIGWLVYNFALAFGTTGGGQILAIFLVTLIVRLIIVVASAGSLSSQNKMSEIQPQMAMLQAKYPNSSTNKYEQQKLASEQMALYKKNKIHPFRQILVLIVQFPIFIAVWGALQGSAILTTGSVFGLQLSTVTYKAIVAGTSETPFAIILFILMAIAQLFASLLPTWIQAWKKKRVVGAKTVKVNEDSTTGTMMKWMPMIMMVVVIVMGLNLAAAMGIYWFFGALISIIQTIVTEIVMAFRKNRKPKNKDKDKFTKFKKTKHMDLGR